MLVAHLNLQPDWRGGENQALLLARGLRDRGISQVLIAYPGGVLWKKAQEASLAVMSLRRFGEWDLLAAYKLRTLLKSLGPDLLQVHTAHDAALAAVATQGLSTRLLVMRTVDFPIQDNAVSRWKYRKADRIVAVSRCVADGLKNQGLDEKKITVIYPCIDVEEVRSAKPHPDFSGGSWVGMFGALTAQKDPLTFIEAAALAAKENTAARFAIAGEGHLRAAAEERVRSLGLEKKLSLLGFRQDALSIMAAMNVVVISSVNEGLNLTILEAGALGIPVVATKVGGVPEAVRDGETGFLVPKGDAPAIARRVNDLLRDDGLRRKMGDRGKEFVKSFAIERIADQYGELYRDVLYG